MLPEKDSETEENVFDDFDGGNEMDSAKFVEDDKISSGDWIFVLFNL